MYKFLISSDITAFVKLKMSATVSPCRSRALLHVEGNLSKLLAPDKPLPSAISLRDPSTADFYVTVQLFADGKPLVPPCTSSFGTLTTSSQYTWNQTITFPIKYQALPLNAQLVFTVWDITEPSLKVPAGGTSLRLFGPRRTLRKGRQKLHLWEARVGDGSSTSKTPGKISSTSELDRIETLVKKYARKQIERVEWLDRLAFTAIEKINRIDDEASNRLALFIELPDFCYPVVFHEKISNKKMSEVIGKDVVTFYDPDINRENPIEAKHIKLTRSRLRRPHMGISDRDLKPNSEEREELNTLIAYPPTRHLTHEEKEKLWKFRFFLRDNKKALIKFLKSVDWNHAQEQEEAFQLLEEWEPMDVDDALELLTSQFAHLPRIRQYAVRRLETYPDEELQYYLLQLVQALRYDKSPLSDLASFLIRRGVANPIIGNYLYWYLKVECESPNDNDRFQCILKEFLQALTRLAKGDQMAATFKIQEEVIESWTAMCAWVKRSSLPRPKKIEKIKEMLREGGEFAHAATLSQPIRFPLDPSIEFRGVKNDVYIFKSKMEPLRLNIDVCGPKPMTIIFKMGDDLRQDQLVVQLISLMDRLLKQENLDLKLSPYKVLATSRVVGMLECVPNAKNISEVLKEYGGDLKKYLKHHNPDPNADYGIKPQVLNNFVRSCAGYCVITYILGIGDRHLDNLLLTHDGRLFHIDFGFILGRDPKPFPPPMKLCQEMVEGMGGKDSVHYSEFQEYCCEAYNILRKSANLILNLFALMVDGNIQDIDQGEKSIVKVQEKLRLDLTDEEANVYFRTLITESVRALFPQIAETVHRWANYWRS